MQNKHLVKRIEALDHDNITSTATKKVLDEKISKIEASAYKAFQEKSLEITSLKSRLKKQES